MDNGVVEAVKPVHGADGVVEAVEPTSEEVADPGIVHDLVKLVLARMESNPEEFAGYTLASARWLDALSAITACATDYEREVVETKRKELVMERAYKSMLETLCADPAEERDEAKSSSAIGINPAGVPMPTVQGLPVGGLSTSGTLSSTTNVYNHQTDSVSLANEAYRDLLQQARVRQEQYKTQSKYENAIRMQELKHAQQQIAGTANQPMSWGSVLGSLLGGKK